MKLLSLEILDLTVSDMRPTTKVVMIFKDDRQESKDLKNFYNIQETTNADYLLLLRSALNLMAERIATDEAALSASDS